MRHQRKGSYLLTFLFVFSFAFDFKGKVGGTPVQYAMAVLNTIAFLLLGIKHRFRIRKTKGFLLALFGWGLFVLFGSLSAIYNSVPWGQYLRTVYPFVLFAEGMWVAEWVVKDDRSASVILNTMITASLVSFFFVFLWGYFMTGEDIANIRYQILSPLIPFLLITIWVELFVAKRHRGRSFLLLMIILFVESLSATRGVILSFGTALFILVIAWLTVNLASKGAIIPKSWVIGTTILGIGAVLVVFAVYFFAPFLFNKWLFRFVDGATMATFWTRASAVMGQWNQLSEQASVWFLGKGFGHGYYYAKEFIPYVVPHVRLARFSQINLFAGEFMWMPFLYYGGIVPGSCAIYILLRGLVRSFRILMSLIHSRMWQSSVFRYEWISVMGYLALMGQGMTSNPFMTRPGALFFGLLFGLVHMDWRRLHT